MKEEEKEFAILPAHTSIAVHGATLKRRETAPMGQSLARLSIPGAAWAHASVSLYLSCPYL